MWLVTRPSASRTSLARSAGVPGVTVSTVAPSLNDATGADTLTVAR